MPLKRRIKIFEDGSVMAAEEDPKHLWFDILGKKTVAEHEIDCSHETWEEIMNAPHRVEKILKRRLKHRKLARQIEKVRKELKRNNTSKDRKT